MSGEVEEGDPQAGLEYAKEVCANCHGISNAQSPVPEATAFTEIANETGMSAKAIEGRAWLDNPVLHWETSEIECLCKPWTPSSQVLSSAVAIQSRVTIEVWDDDLVRLWGSDNSVSQSGAKNGGLIATPRGQMA